METQANQTQQATALQQQRILQAVSELGAAEDLRYFISGLDDMALAALDSEHANYRDSRSKMLCTWQAMKGLLMQFI